MGFPLFSLLRYASLRACCKEMFSFACFVFVPILPCSLLISFDLSYLFGGNLVCINVRVLIMVNQNWIYLLRCGQRTITRNKPTNTISDTFTKSQHLALDTSFHIRRDSDCDCRYSHINGSFISPWKNQIRNAPNCIFFKGYSKDQESINPLPRPKRQGSLSTIPQKVGSYVFLRLF